MLCIGKIDGGEEFEFISDCNGEFSTYFYLSDGGDGFTEALEEIRDGRDLCYENGHDLVEALRLLESGFSFTFKSYDATLLYRALNILLNYNMAEITDEED